MSINHWSSLGMSAFPSGSSGSPGFGRLMIVLEVDRTLVEATDSLVIKHVQCTRITCRPTVTENGNEQMQMYDDGVL